jgi:hypothetical protein
VTAARLAARCVELLGAVDGPVAISAADGVRAALAARLRTADAREPAAAACCVLVGERIDDVTRRTRLAALAARLPDGAPLVIVDHNQPRAWWRRGLGALLLLAHGHGPARARQPVARDVQAAGFVVERLRFADGERLQLVVARRRA